MTCNTEAFDKRVCKGMRKKAECDADSFAVTSAYCLTKYCMTYQTYLNFVSHKYMKALKTTNKRRLYKQK